MKRLGERLFSYPPGEKADARQDAQITIVSQMFSDRILCKVSLF